MRIIPTAMVVGLAVALFTAGYLYHTSRQRRVAVEMSDQPSIDPRNLSYRNTLDRVRADCSDVAADNEAATILVFGQSLAANFGPANALHLPSGGVDNFNFFYGRCYRARDPLLGAEGDRSNFVTRLADLLVKRGVFKRVMLVPIAYGGSPIAW
jgi:hypothetical protein